MIELGSNITKKKRDEFKLNIQNTIKAFQEDETKGSQLTVEAKTRRLTEIKDFFSWCKEYYPSFASSEFNAIHYYLINEAVGASKLYPLAGPRASAKTTIVKLYMIYAICKKEIKVGVILSHTEKLAKNILDNVVEMIRSNHKLLYDYSININETSEHRYIINNVCFFIATHKIAFRGLIHLEHRPDFVFIDDFENRNTVANRDICNNKIEYILSEALGGMDETQKYTFIWVGNLIQRGSAIDIAIKENPKTGRRFQALYKNDVGVLESYWPERYSVDKLLQIKEKYNSRPWIWYGEYQQKYYNKSSVLKIDWLQTISKGDEPKKYFRTISILDPAFSKNRKACMKAFLTGSIDKSDADNCKYYIHDLYLRHGTYSDFLKYANKSVHQFNSQANTVYYENNAEQWFSIKPSYDALEAGVKKYLKMKPFYNDQKIKKELRIESQIEPMEQGRLFVAQSVLDSDDWQELLTQWGRYPVGLLDGPDIVTMFMIHIHNFNYSFKIFRPGSQYSEKRRKRYISGKNKQFKLMRNKHVRNH